MGLGIFLPAVKFWYFFPLPVVVSYNQGRTKIFMSPVNHIDFCHVMYIFVKIMISLKRLKIMCWLFWLIGPPVVNL